VRRPVSALESEPVPPNIRIPLVAITLPDMAQQQIATHVYNSSYQPGATLMTFSRGCIGMLLNSALMMLTPLADL
jgi:hypothetical protein